MPASPPTGTWSGCSRRRLRRAWRRALRSPPSWLDDLGSDEPTKTIHSATVLLPSELITEEFAVATPPRRSCLQLDYREASP